MSGNYPRLHDNGTFGGHYTYHLTDTWGMQLSAGYNPSRSGQGAGGDTSLSLTTVDLDLEWDMLSSLNLFGHNLVPYTVLGVGSAWATLDNAMYGICH